MNTKLYGPYTFGALNAEQTIPVPANAIDVLIQVIGTSTQTIQFQDSLDGGTTYSSIRLEAVDTGTLSNNITAAGLFLRGGLVLRAPKLRNTGYTSGSFTVYALVRTL
ncbi:MAG: hypothetical protein ACREDF_06490 [Thermoplasmata archaeon]